MRVILHIGPHKTGTTSLQAALLARYGADAPQTIWYPRPSAVGPGHAEIAWSCLGLHGRTKSDEALNAVVARAHGTCETLILSSESFDYMVEHGTDVIAAALADTDVQIVTTLSPIARRAVSLWQEMVKHGRCEPIEQCLDVVLRHPSLRADFIDVMIAGFPHARHDLIVVDPSAPEDLFAAFARVAAIDLPAPESREQRRLNPSLDLVEVELVRALNVLFRDQKARPDQAMAARGSLLDMFASPRWLANAPIPLERPQSWNEPLSRLWTATLANIEHARARNRLNVHGDVECLNDLSAQGSERSRVMAQPT